MRVIWIYVTLTCVVVAICDDIQSISSTTTLEPLPREISEDVGEDSDENNNESGNLSNHRIDTGDNNDDEDTSELPVLPPIILLDFGDDSENNSTSDEKSKRTINNELGYGYLKNNLFNGRYNYYFPGGKTGTTVSIEESISPFEPKTIIEPFKSNTERPIISSSTYQPELTGQVDQPLAQPWAATFPSSQQIFGQRTKLRKAPSNTFSYQYFSTTSQPDYNNHNMGFTTPKPFNNRYNTYSSTPGYNTKYNVVGMSPPGATYLPESSTTPRPTLSDDPTLFNLPRFTVENGIKYENKIIWKYPDGRVAENPSTSYVNSYSELSNSQINNGVNKNIPFKTSLNHQSPPLLNSGLGKFRNDNSHTYHTTSNIHQAPRYPMEPISNIHSQRPAQFPVNQESNFPPRSSSDSQIHTFDFSYQDNYGLRQRGNGAQSSIRNEKLPSRTSLKLSVDTDNPEYTYTPPARSFETTTSAPNSVTESAHLSPQVISKYTPQIQKYLTKVFDPKNNEKSRHQQQQQHQYQHQHQQQNINSAAFVKNNYENLLSYNPSISQYIRDPSTILNAQPTFIQAGNSLVPVIILRVDGARPIETQPSSNINLKSLLQQYITNYIGNQVSNENYGYDDHKVVPPSDNYNLLNDLSQFSEALRRYSLNGNSDLTKTSRLRLADHPLNYDDIRYTPKTSYEVSESRTNLNDNLRTKNDGKTKKLQKIKNVEIINGPHIQNYRELSQS